MVSNMLYFSAELERVCPELPNLVSNAGNTGHGNVRKETPVQVLLQVHNRIQLARKVAKDGEGIHLDAIVKKIEKDRPQLAGQVMDISTYVLPYAGGPSAPYLKELDNFSKQLRIRRTVPASQFGLLGKCKLGDHPSFMTAMVMADLVAPDHASYLVRGEARIWTSFDIGQIQSESKLKTSAIEANELMVKARSWLLSLRTSDTATAVGLYGD